MKSIVINLTQKCNAKCAHCCFECLPNSSNYLTDDEIEKIVFYAESHDDVKVVSLTGGEALLCKNKVLEIIQRLSLVGKETTLISNAFWATTEAVTERILSELKLAGLNYLTISYDDYHAEYIPISNVKRLLTIIKKFDIEVALNMVVDRKHIGVDLLKDLGESVFGVRVTMVPASPVGRANDLNHNDLYFKTIEELELTCPAQPGGSLWYTTMAMYILVVHHLFLKAILELGVLQNMKLRNWNLNFIQIYYCTY